MHRWRICVASGGVARGVVASASGAALLSGYTALARRWCPALRSCPWQPRHPFTATASIHGGIRWSNIAWQRRRSPSVQDVAASPFTCQRERSRRRSSPSQCANECAYPISFSTAYPTYIRYTSQRFGWALSQRILSLRETTRVQSLVTRNRR